MTSIVDIVPCHMPPCIKPFDCLISSASPTSDTPTHQSLACGDAEDVSVRPIVSYLFVLELGEMSYMLGSLQSFQTTREVFIVSSNDSRCDRGIFNPLLVRVDARTWRVRSHALTQQRPSKESGRPSRNTTPSYTTI